MKIKPPYETTDLTPGQVYFLRYQGGHVLVSAKRTYTTNIGE